MKKLLSLALALALTLALTGCVYVELSAAAHADGSGVVAAVFGVTEEAVGILGMEEQIASYGYQPFTAGGVSYYGTSGAWDYATPEEANDIFARVAASARSICGEYDPEFDPGRVVLLENSDGSLTLSFLLSRPLDAEAMLTAIAPRELDDETKQALLSGLSTTYSFTFDSPVRQVVGPASGVTLTDTGVTLDLAAMSAGTYQFSTTAGKIADTAYPSRSDSVLLDGVETELAFYALRDENGNETNYVMLRNVASALSGTDAHFLVDYDGAVQLRRGEDNSGVASAPFTDEQSAVLTTPVTYIDGALSALDAIILTDENGGGYTYYKLRDLGNALGFNVYWDPDLGAIAVQSDRPYTGVKGE